CARSSQDYYAMDYW
nr:immunoglobulin heavy chain junction region [Mus musculus]MBK4188269.1 immunoglobulin heavy chain junction region [Mus musculus]